MAGGESRCGMTDGVDGAVDYVGIAASGDVVESAADCEVVSEKVEAFFGLEVEGEVGGETLGAGWSDEFLLVVEEVEGGGAMTFL